MKKQREIYDAVSKEAPEGVGVSIDLINYGCGLRLVLSRGDQAAIHFLLTGVSMPKKYVIKEFLEFMAMADGK